MLLMNDYYGVDKMLTMKGQEHFKYQEVQSNNWDDSILTAARSQGHKNRDEMLIVWRKRISAASGSFNVPRKVDKSAKVTSLMAATVNVTTRLEAVNSSTRKLVDLTQENGRNASVELNFANTWSKSCRLVFTSTSTYSWTMTDLKVDQLESRWEQNWPTNIGRGRRRLMKNLVARRNWETGRQIDWLSLWIRRWLIGSDTFHFFAHLYITIGA